MAYLKVPSKRKSKMYYLEKVLWKYLQATFSDGDRIPTHAYNVSDPQVPWEAGGFVTER